MKKLCIIFILLLSSIGMFAQEQENKKYDAYCEVCCFVNRFDKKTITIEIDNKEYSIVKDNKDVVLVSATQAMRLLSELGWKLNNTFGSMRELTEKNYYVMIKEVTSEEEITKGLKEK